MLRRDACFRRSEMLECPWPTHHRAHRHRPDKPPDDHRGQLPRPTDCRPRLALGVHGREDPRRVRLGSSGNADLTRSERKFTFKRQRRKKYFTDRCSSFIKVSSRGFFDVEPSRVYIVVHSQILWRSLYLISLITSYMVSDLLKKVNHNNKHSWY